ncbi:2-epi-5-epi-valiolone synthase-like [Acipenser ruthenus]|uniref:2-epi-5-epi-valiolone synthase-like n=1 Tax=Acipenser ruthenus TaxID=7906 RepID=UPI00274164DD|nr:2-epi-5-epi-valiolone synthase-like [Acipenser ruthenus]
MANEEICLWLTRAGGTDRRYESTSEQGKSWTIVSPIYFRYKVVESQNLLEPGNDTLLTGHLRDPGQLDAFRSSTKPIKRFVVIDETVNQLYGPQVNSYFEARNVNYKILPLPTTEENKSMELVMKILKELHSFLISRHTEPIIAIGGRVCLDIVGFAASLYRRHTPYIRVPTTLLSYVDASVGAKTGVNFSQCKNKLGSYIPPVATFLDRSFIQTVPRRQISNGLAEMLKMALMKHKGLFELLESHGKFLLDTNFQSCNGLLDHGCVALMTSRIAIETMLEELAPNLWEDDLDRLVDFGHLISSELEMKVLPTLMHGEAVNIDMAYMTYVSNDRGFLTTAERNRIIQCMKNLELPVWHHDFSLNLVKKSLNERLKHSEGLQRMPLPTGVGTTEIFNDIDDEVLERSFKKWCEDLSTEE